MPARHAVRFDVSVEHVRAAAMQVPEIDEKPEGALAGSLPSPLVGTDRFDIDLRPEGPGCAVEISAPDPEAVPYWNWLLGPLARRILRRNLAGVADRIAAALEGDPLPEPPRRSLFTAPVPFDTRATRSVATVAAMQVVTGFGASLFSTNIDFIGNAFDASDRALGVAGAVTRAGVLLALFAAALADRRGRRVLLLGTFAGVTAASGLSVVAPTLGTFTAAQLLSRGFFNANFIIAAIVAVEEAPERGRAFALSMVVLARSAGSALTVVMLPLADLGTEAWRVSYAVSALTILLLASFRRNLPETFRFTGVAARMAQMGRFRELLGQIYRWRFVLLILVAFLTNLLAAPSSQFTNRYLGDQRGFSGLETSIFLAVTGGLPGLLGLFVGGRLAESWGRKPVAVPGLAAGAALTMVFFVSTGPFLWLFGTVDLFLAGVITPATAAFSAELFPTEVRGTANAWLLVAGVIGSAAGLLTVGALSDVMSLGGAIAWMGIAPLAVALFVIPRLPEPRGRDLDVISPPEV